MMVNGTVRTLGYEDQLSDLAAHQLATLLLTAAPIGYTWLLPRWRPLPTVRSAIGWARVCAVLTLAFEVGLGTTSSTDRAGGSGRHGLTAGRIWVLVPVTPAVIRALQSRRRRNDG